LIAVLLLAPLAALCAAETFLVENGQPLAEIVISENPARMQRVAASEFRADIEKISGARLPIVTKPSGNAVKVFIGRSVHTAALKITTDDLQHGAYRIATGPDWMALVGDDTDFTPTPPWAKSNGDIPRAQAEWEKIVGTPYGMPNPGLYKNRLRLPGDTGKPDGATTAKNETLEIWGFDERGSFNAVCGFLRKLGARWYLPGELGEVLPSLETIPLPKIDETVRPDFPLRQFNFRFSTAGYDTSMWVMRLGIRNDNRMLIAHGMARMTGRDAVFAAHPDWFALYGEKRDYTPGDSKNQLCYSNEELFRETVRYARALLDTYCVTTVSIMPPDGCTAICQCEKCKGKDSPDRNERGLLSDYVWDFVNRVAKQVGETHPDAKILNAAYGAYTLPPLKIDKLEPNVLVCIVGGRRPINKAGAKGEGEAAPEALRAAWVKKTDNPILIFENYPFTGRGWYLPSFAPHALAETVNATKSISQGEDIWLTVEKDFDKAGVGFNHFLVYFTARMYWGGKDADVDAVFREYCRLFYGPAEKEMHAFFTYCEANWSAMGEDKSKADTALDLFADAQAKADAASVYGKRLALIDDYLKGLRMKSQQLGQKRGPVPVVRLVWDAKDIVVDGKFDEAYWQNCPTAATGKLRELQTGRQPVFGTSFKAGWQGNSVYFAIRCDERPGEEFNIAAARNDDQAIWYGDAIEIQLATETHSYYQIAVSPSGAVVDLDRGAPKGQWFGWDSKAEVATHIADDHWTVEIRVPVTQDENDPLHQVIGRKPTQSLPWHINICRQRIREGGAEYSALSPTGTKTFHEPMKFAYFYDGRSHRFDADPSVTDFVITSRAAEKLRKPAEALPAWLKLAESNATPLQRSLALEQAAAATSALKDSAQAAALAARVPMDAVKKTVQMQNFLAQHQAANVISTFAGEDIAKWPFWQRSGGFHARGRAYAITKAANEAESDLSNALAWTSEPHICGAIQLALANNRENNLKDDARALESYQAIVAGRTHIGGADEFAALQGIARIFTRQGKFDEAIAALNRAEVSKLKGVWRGNILLSIGDVHLAAGRKTEARAAFQAVLDDKTLERRRHQAAEERIRSTPWK
jgi:tetratricopeptide (TPR) repeat protein